MLRLIKVPPALPGARVHFAGRERIDRTKEREKERANSIFCLPFRYVPLYNVTYSTVATLRLIKSVLTPANAIRFFTVSCSAVDFRTRITGETRRAYAIRVSSSNWRYTGWSRFREDENPWLMWKEFQLLWSWIVNELINTRYCKIAFFNVILGISNNRSSFTHVCILSSAILINNIFFCVQTHSR